MTTADCKRIGREAARDFANSTVWLDLEPPGHKEMATQALAQVIASHLKNNLGELLSLEPSGPIHVKDSIVETPGPDPRQKSALPTDLQSENLEKT